MELIFLGTSSGTPTKQRNVFGVALKKANSKSWQLVDCGEGTQHQILKTNLALTNLQSIFITHVHGDHCYGLPGLLASATMSGRTEPLTIMGPAAIKELLEVVGRTTRLKLSFQIDFLNVEDGATPYDSHGFGVESVKLSHRVPSFGYIFCEQDIQPKLNIPKLKKEGVAAGPLWGRIQKGEMVGLPDGRVINGAHYLLEARKGRKIIIAGDNDSPELLAQSARSADVLVHEATYTEDVAEKVGKGPQHSSAKRVACFAEQAGIANLILTHFSPRYQYENAKGATIKDLDLEAREWYRGDLFLANDLDVFRLGQQGGVTRVSKS